MFIFRLKVEDWNCRNQIRQRGAKSDLNWKLQISNTSRKSGRATSSEGFSSLPLYLLLNVRWKHCNQKALNWSRADH